ncbi:killer cell lectin-like receptor subfamily G member 1 [Protopterus annectens]|uniref:killer cell lectin-like receptor subfamily G member 1 n=1 Tax=Protopterus annectens TaxID=7888 RepID=UPI001CFB11F3|nr:killer cell lectin-like receptor subfamily G member 1 [Protopterus annectens]
MQDEIVTYAEIKLPKSAGKIKAGIGRDNNAAPKRNRLITYRYCIVAQSIICFLLAATVVLLLVLKYPSENNPRDCKRQLCNESNVSCRICPEPWIKYHVKCYLFFKEKIDWNASKEFCSTHRASLFTNPDKDVTV